MTLQAPVLPVGEWVRRSILSSSERETLIEQIAAAPTLLRAAVDGLGEDRLATKYRNWTIRQIVHHLADSHLNSYVRFKWTLTEDKPLIKAYDEGQWSDLLESRSGAISASLLMFEGLHARWVQLLDSLTVEQFARCFVHPDSGQTLSLNEILTYYAWHGRHHTGQITWLRERQCW